MILNKIFHFIVFLSIITLSSCSFVETYPNSESIHVISKDEINDCIEIAKSKHTVLDEILKVDLMDEYIKTKLDQLAKNYAVTVDADSIAQLEKVDRGTAIYGSYNCLK